VKQNAGEISCSLVRLWAHRLGEIEKDCLLRRREDERAGLRETEHEGEKAPLASLVYSGLKGAAFSN
jgi:hypothetical protein